MSKHERDLRSNAFARFLGGVVRRRGGFEGPEEVYPPTPDQIPKVILVDGEAVEPQIDLPEDSPPPTDSDPAPKEADEQEG